MKIYPITQTSYKNTNRYTKPNSINKKTNYMVQQNPSFLLNFTGKINVGYSDWFKAYLKHTNEKRLIADEVISILKSSSINDFLNSKNQIQILDIGCGNGDLTGMILNGIHEIFPHKKIFTEALDVNSKLLNEFKSNTADLPQNINIISKKEDFFSDKFRTDANDIILASHVLYYADNLPSALLKIKNALSNNGCGIIIHHSGKDCILAKLRAKYNPLSDANLRQSDMEISKNDIILQQLKNLKIEHKSFLQPFSLKLPDDITNLHHSPETQNLISFIIDKPYHTLLKENKIKNIKNELTNLADKDNNLNLFNNMYIIKGNGHD